MATLPYTRFRLRKDAPCHSPKPAGYCFGWDCSLAPDYAASGFIMGVGASLRWLEDVGLQSTLERLLQELATCSNDNGWFLPWSESEMAANWYAPAPARSTGGNLLVPLPNAD